MLTKIIAMTVLLSMPMLVCAQADKSDTQINVVWYQIGELPVRTDEDEVRNLSSAKSFVGVHNDGLIVAGGANIPIAAGQQRSSNKSSRTNYDSIWVATRDTGSDVNGDGDVTPDERPLTWHDTQLRLPENWAHGASASHKIGLIVIGSTDREAAHSDVHLIRWNEGKQQASMSTLPTIPSNSVDRGAAIIGDKLYVLIGNNGAGSMTDLFSFDLSRIQTDEAGEPITDGDIVKIINKHDQEGRPVSPWQQLPSLPRTGDDHRILAHRVIVAQNDGRGDRLFVIGGRRTTVEAESAPHPQPNKPQLRSRDNSVVWAFNSDKKDLAMAWTRKADVRLDGKSVWLNVAVGSKLGQSHILVLAGIGGNSKSTVLSYNAITDAWASYDEAPLASLPARTDVSERSVFSLSKNAVRWENDIILTTNSMRSGNELPRIWAIQVTNPNSSFGWQNTVVLVAYLMLMVMVGVYFAFKNNDTDDYFRGGQNIPWWAAGCSIYATMLSSLTFLALPALVFRTDWLLYPSVFTVLLVSPIVVRVVMPFFRQIDATSAYEYLSKRFNMPVRLFASALFTCFQIGRMGIVLALTALALAAVTPLDPWQSVLLMGVLSMVYSTMGGIEAVVWTDTIQVFVLTIGALTCFVFIINGIDGGFSGFIDSALADNKFRIVDLNFSADSITSLSIWVIVLGGIGQNLSTYSADQAVVQRYMTTRNINAAATSIWTNAIITVPGVLLFFFIGTGLYSFYQSQPAKLNPNLQIDQIFPAFVGAELPIGIAGLIVAGIFAAAQSTVSSSMNSTATTIITDFMRPFNACRSEHNYLKAARSLTVLMGILGTLVGLLFISPAIRSLMEEYFKVIGMFMGALSGLFLLGMTTRRANGRGALIGILASVGVMVLVWQSQWANGYIFATIGILGCLLIGYLASLVLPSDHRNIDGLTIYTMRRDRSSFTKRAE